MPSLIEMRQFSEQERVEVEKWLAQSPTSTRRTKQFLENVLVLWAASMLASVAALAALRWLASKTGWTHGEVLLGLPMLLVVGLATLAYAIRSSVKWISGWEDKRPALRSALMEGRAQVETYALIEAKRYQEPEHGGLIYLLRADDDRVVCLYDPESQQLGAEGNDPLGSTFEVRRNLKIVRVPSLGWPLSVVMTGEPLTVGNPSPLNLTPQDWPEADQVIDLRWNAADAFMSAKRRPRDI